MSPSAKRFIYSGHALGAAAQFHRLDELEKLNHVVPILGASVLPVTGGISKGHAANYCFDVDQPRKRTLLSVRRIDTMASGRVDGGNYVTEIEAEIESLSVVEKLRVGLVKMHMVSAREIDGEGGKTKISTKGSRIEGLHLGRVEAKVVLDNEPLTFCGSKDQLAKFFRGQSPAYRSANAHRFATDPSGAELSAENGRATFSLVQEIQLSGTQDPDHPVRVEGYTIVWEGFGRIILGEVLVKGNDRRITMLRLAMGSDAGGSGSVGDGSSNGQSGN